MKEIENLKFRPFTRFCMSIGTVPSSYLAGLTIEEQLLWFCSYLEKEVVPVVNNNSEVVAELQSFVKHYFDNLDVQEEINNKLDAMAEDGTLQQIIEEYILLNSPIICNTVADMIANENLLDGSVVKTLGFYNVGDGGDGYYKITDDSLSANNKDIFLLDNDLYAQLIQLSTNINIVQYGAKADDNTFDNATIIKYVIDKLDSLGGGTLYVPTGKFYSSAITYSTGRLRNITIKGNGHQEDTKGSELLYTGNDTFMTFNQLWNFSIEDIKINTTSEVAQAMKVNDGFYRCKIYNCTFRDFKYGLEASTFAYVYLEKTSFTSLLDNGFHVRLGHNQTGLCEFFYIDECMFNGSDENQNFDGIIINAGSSYKINKCDFANLGESHAIVIESTENANIVDVSIESCNIIRCDNGIEVYAKTSPIVTIMIDKLMYYFRGDNNDDIAIYTHRDSDYTIELFIKNLALRQLASYTGNVFSFTATRGQVDIISNITSAVPNVPNKLMKYTYQPTLINQEYTLTMNGSATYGYIDLLNTSPYNEKPPIIVLARTSMEVAPSINIINTFKDKLRLMVSWASAPDAGNYVFQVFLQ